MYSVSVLRRMHSFSTDTGYILRTRTRLHWDFIPYCVYNDVSSLPPCHQLPTLGTFRYEPQAGDLLRLLVTPAFYGRLCGQCAFYGRYTQGCHFHLSPPPCHWRGVSVWLSAEWGSCGGLVTDEISTALAVVLAPAWGGWLSAVPCPVAK